MRPTVIIHKETIIKRKTSRSIGNREYDMELSRVKNKSIREIVNEIDNGNIILPALQREFVWKRKDIIRLFDSLLQSYPINTMMFWEVDNISQQKMEFYKFIDCNYQEGHYNQPYNTANDKRVTVVIDGQQRLSSLYIGIYGSYRTSGGKNKQYLYLNLDNSSLTNDDDNNKYLLKFLTTNEATRKQKKGEHWIRVHDVYSAKFNLDEYCKQHNLNRISKKILKKLYQLLRNTTKCLNYYNIKDNNIDNVLEVFVRTNNGGKPISKGDLLLSMITVLWAKSNRNARDYVEGIIKKVATQYSYKVDKNWVLGCILYILNGDVKLSAESFTQAISQDIYKHRNKIETSILSSCKLVKKFGIQERGLTSKLALFPIVYHIYYFNSNICKPKRGVPLTIDNDVKSIRTWLFRSTLMGFFAGQTYDKLSCIRDVQHNCSSKTKFPINEIINLKTPKSNYYLHLPTDFYNTLLDTSKKDSFPILNIIFSECISNNFNESYDVDHIHSKDEVKKSLLSFNCNYDTLPNLQLLTGDQNKSKNKMTLINWIQGMVKNHHENKLVEMLLPINNIQTNYDIGNFDNFFDERKKALLTVIKEKLDDTLP